jgi:hypothetical protein
VALNKIVIFSSNILFNDIEICFKFLSIILNWKHLQTLNTLEFFRSLSITKMADSTRIFIVIHMNAIFDIFFLIESLMPIISLEVILIPFASNYPSVSSPDVTFYIACSSNSCSQITCKYSRSPVIRTNSVIMYTQNPYLHNYNLVTILLSCSEDKFLWILILL